MDDNVTTTGGPYIKLEMPEWDTGRATDADIARAEATRLAEQVEELWAEVRGLLKMVKEAEGE